MEKENARILPLLACPYCRRPCKSRNESLACTHCKKTYPLKGGVPFFLPQTLHHRYAEEAATPVNRLKGELKKYPVLFQFLHTVIGSVSYFGLSARGALERAFGSLKCSGKVIINVGSGVKRIHREVINLDVFPLKGVNVVADAAALPFSDATVDMVISESVLEHVPDAEAAIREMTRVIRPGGYLYVSIPFIMGFHASPNDYLRLTHAGLRQKFADFEPLRIGMIGGPASALVTFLMYFLALPFSVISESVYNVMTYVFLVALSPLRFLDVLFNLFPRAIEIAAVIYFFGRKAYSTMPPSSNTDSSGRDARTAGESGVSVKI